MAGAITATTQVITLTATNHFPIKLTATNFPVWKCQVQSALIGLGLDGYIDGTITTPDQFLDTAKTQINPCYTIWYRQDKTIISALLGSCSDTIQPVISSALTAKHAWDKLDLTYASTSRGRIISLKTTLSHTKKGSRSIPDYLTEMQAIADDLALAQNPVSDQDLLVHILNGLGPEYGDLTSAIRVRETPLPFSELQSILLEREERIREEAASAPTLVPTINATQPYSRSNIPFDRRPATVNDKRPTTGPRRGHGGMHTSASRPSSNLICRFCENLGHEVQACRKLQRFLRDNKVPYPAVPNIQYTTAAMPPGHQPWLFDSGASHHVTSDASQLPTYTDYGGPDEVHLGNGPNHGGASTTRGESS
ncbi:unnamed protein product [Cuscuta epithymum]|uniref:Retrotransposon Copia-like N-terminal domain-containing protein n=1 Tax=Cuscuta epithymum TaxID=186058 RepID=A0AAV0EKR2_9ASTE|nr:unnamed protein product [Cuscuta epithymum]